MFVLFQCLDESFEKKIRQRGVAIYKTLMVKNKKPKFQDFDAAMKADEKIYELLFEYYKVDPLHSLFLNKEITGIIWINQIGLNKSQKFESQKKPPGILNELNKEKDKIIPNLEGPSKNKKTSHHQLSQENVIVVIVILVNFFR